MIQFLPHLMPGSVPSIDVAANNPSTYNGPDLASILAGNLGGIAGQTESAIESVISEVLPSVAGGQDAGSIVNNIPDEVQDDGTSVGNANDGGFSLANFMANNPGASPEEIMAEAAKHGDEFAEKYLDYLVEKSELEVANAYTAQREDTAYQRLVNDLKKAGLNPALMYGSTASTSAAGSQGYVKMVEGANSRTIGNYDKVKKLLLALLQYELEKGLGVANTVIDGVGSITKIIPGLLKVLA